MRLRRLIVASLAMALWFDGPSLRGLAGALAAGFIVTSLALLTLIRPFRRGRIAGLVPFLVVLAWWSAIPARNDRAWSADVARLPRASIAGSRLTIESLDPGGAAHDRRGAPHPV